MGHAKRTIIGQLCAHACSADFLNVVVSNETIKLHYRKLLETLDHMNLMYIRLCLLNASAIAAHRSFNLP
jgi:hypothetical protein